MSRTDELDLAFFLLRWTTFLLFKQSTAFSRYFDYFGYSKFKANPTLKAMLSFEPDAYYNMSVMRNKTMKTALLDGDIALLDQEFWYGVKAFCTANINDMRAAKMSLLIFMTEANKQTLKP